MASLNDVKFGTSQGRNCRESKSGSEVRYLNIRSHPDHAVVFAIDDSACHALQLFKSVQSIKQTGTNVPIYVHAYCNSLPRTLSELSRWPGVSIVHESSRFGDTPTFLKWAAVSNPIHAKRDAILYLDADTIVSGDPAKFFAVYSPDDFYAREECDASHDAEPRWIGSFKVGCQIKTRMMELIRHGLGSRSVSLYNTGVMILRSTFLSRMGAALEEFITLKDLFIEGKLPYPCTNAHLLEEIVATLVLGRMPQVRFGKLDREFAPFYLELKEGVVRTRGEILHIWGYYYADYLREFEGDDAAQSYMATKSLISTRNQPSMAGSATAEGQDATT
jgi:hypothetical protein